MKLVVLCPHFAPDVAPTGVVMTSIVEELAARGHTIQVVTALPWYLHHAVEPDYAGRLVRREATAWGEVVRVHPFPTDKRDIPRRAVAFASFSALVGLRGLLGGRADVVLAMSPPLSMGLTGWGVALVRRAPLVFNIQDVFPDVAIDLGVLRGRSTIALARWLERLSYARAAAVTVLSEDLRENVAAKVAPRRRDVVRVIPNFVDTRAIRPLGRDTAYRRELGLGERTVVMYAGNVGLSQSLELVVEAAKAFADDPSVVFVINGSGSARPALEAASAGLPNVVWRDLQPVERLGEVLATGDVHVIPLKRGLARASVPSKTYSIMAAGRPFVASVDPGTEVARMAEASGGGLAVPPEDGPAFVAALRRLVGDADERARRGAAARRHVETWASPAAVAEAYERLFGELRERRRRG